MEEGPRRKGGQCAVSSSDPQWLTGSVVQTDYRGYWGHGQPCAQWTPAPVSSRLHQQDINQILAAGAKSLREQMLAVGSESAPGASGHQMKRLNFICYSKGKLCGIRKNELETYI